MNNDMKPSFICIGPGRTGTTWLFNYLQNHKDVYVVPGKEINFFNNFYEKGFDCMLHSSKVMFHVKERFQTHIFF